MPPHFLLESGSGASSPDVAPETRIRHGWRVLLPSRSLGPRSDPNSSPFFRIWVEAGSEIGCAGSGTVFSPRSNNPFVLGKGGWQSHSRRWSRSNPIPNSLKRGIGMSGSRSRVPGVQGLGWTLQPCPSLFSTCSFAFIQIQAGKISQRSPRLQTLLATLGKDPVGIFQVPFPCGFFVSPLLSAGRSHLEFWPDPIFCRSSSVRLQTRL